MMTDVFIVSDNIVSPLGYTSVDNFYQLRNDVSGIKQQHSPTLSTQPFCASLFQPQQQELLFKNFDPKKDYTRFEKLLVVSINNALQGATIDFTTEETILIIASTKGNIELLEQERGKENGNENLSLHHSARKTASYFGFKNTPVVISNACISGLTALLTGKRMLESGQYKHAIVAGADLISKFVLSGFQSFQAVSETGCRPFDKNRNGINLGEAAGTIILSTQYKNDSAIQISGGAVSNDANHISGPSRSGLELCIAINKALKQSSLTTSDIGFVSAHGTATVYNDEMEAKAFSLAGMERIPVNSLKGFYGHTLGAAGIIESVIAVHSLRQNLVIPTRGFEESGVSMPINICKSLLEVETNHCLKTASGFGGCNAALVFSKTIKQ